MVQRADLTSCACALELLEVLSHSQWLKEQGPGSCTQNYPKVVPNDQLPVCSLPWFCPGSASALPNMNCRTAWLEMFISIQYIWNCFQRRKDSLDILRHCWVSRTGDSLLFNSTGTASDEHCRGQGMWGCHVCSSWLLHFFHNLPWAALWLHAGWIRWGEEYGRVTTSQEGPLE